LPVPLQNTTAAFAIKLPPEKYIIDY